MSEGVALGGVRASGTNRRLFLLQISLVILAAAWSFGAQGAGGVEEARLAFEQRDYARAMALWTPLAERGVAEALFGLGVMHEKGLGVERDYVEAARLYRRAAQDGYAPAQFNLGAAYEAGRGVPRDLSLAAQWWRKAAEQSFGRAAYNLATLYYYGWGVPQNYEEAAVWYEKAAAAGDSSAVRVLERLRKRIALVPGEEREDGARRDQAAVELKGEAWILDQPAESYTVQVFANWTEASIKRFAGESGLGPDTAVFAARYQDYPWFVMVHGVYPTQAAAQRALDDLPADVKLMGPWIRTMDEVQRLIRDRVIEAAPQPVVIDPLRGPRGEAVELSVVQAPPRARTPDPGARPERPATDAPPAQSAKASAQPPRERTGQEAPIRRPAATEAEPPVRTAHAKPAATGPEASLKAPPQLPAPPVTAISPGKDPLGWIRRQPQGRYTIQIVAETRLSAARSFVEDNDLQDEAAYFAARHDGRLWYAVVLGSFDGLSAARARLEGIPDAWRRWSPWIRDFGGIHEIMLDDLPDPVLAPPAARGPDSGPAIRPDGEKIPDDAQQRLYLGQKAFNAGRYVDAERLWRPLAEAGMKAAQYNIGFLYESGWGVPPDYRLAAEWYARAALQGHAQAQHNLGLMHLEGLGVPKDAARGMHWLRNAADGGNGSAARFLADAYREGRHGLPQDAGLAQYWAKRVGGAG